MWFHERAIRKNELLKIVLPAFLGIFGKLVKKNIAKERANEKKKLDIGMYIFEY